MSDAAYEKGYYEQGEWLDSNHKSLAETERALAERKATVLNSTSYNAGALAATEDYSTKMHEGEGTPQ